MRAGGIVPTSFSPAGMTAALFVALQSCVFLLFSYARRKQLARHTLHSHSVDLSLDDTIRLIAAANGARGHRDLSDRSPLPNFSDAEAQLEARFLVSHTLAVYGSLAPGQSNYHVVAPLGGDWTDGVVEGERHPSGWGATLGYPAFRPRLGGAAVAVRVLTSPLLPADWARLDAFEGAEYRRILVPVFTLSNSGERRLCTVANIYALASGKSERVAPGPS
jgi:gamma-glutamylcyclotransferase (GGCT)/AIG2-like uncharacterized protein YtfP